MKIYIEGRSPTQREDPESEDTAKYHDQYEHPLWKKYGGLAKDDGHGGSDYVTLHQFLSAVRAKTQTPIDLYDSATWSVITPLSRQPVANKSAAVDYPDFTKGKWRTARPVAFEV